MTPSEKPLGNEPSPLVAVVASRLGDSHGRHRRIADLLGRSARDVRRDGGRWLIGSGTAIDPWATRAAELFDVVIVRPDVAAKLRDEAVIDTADRIDALHVRRGGRIDGLLRRRIERSPTTVRVAIGDPTSTAAADLLAAGAVGWYVESAAASVNTDRSIDPHNVPDTDGWLIHCTRGVRGRWPGETPAQYRDSILLSVADVAARREADGGRGPIEALNRIVRGGRLLASAVTSNRSMPVVCFSERKLSELLAHRSYRSHLRRWDYEPFGVAIRTEAACRIGVRPVRYDAVPAGLPDGDGHLAAAAGTTHDWTWEREWRLNRDLPLGEVAPEDLRLFATDTPLHRAKLSSVPHAIWWL